MAIIRDAEGAEQVLKGRTLVGRSRAMELTLPRPEISAQHAVLAWDGQHWSVRDLGSRNGTTVDGVSIESGIPVPLQPGQSILFGDAVSFELISIGAPSPWAQSSSGILEGDGELLAVPSPDDPDFLVLWEDGWQVHHQGTSRPAVSGESLQATNGPWVLHLPEVLAETVEQRSTPSSAAPIRLDFRVSQDEEYVELTVRIGGDAHSLKPRSHHYLLLLLAQRRLDDIEAGNDCGESGWVYTTELMKMLNASSNQLYVSLHRARKDLSAFETLEGLELIERRATTRQVRIGIADLAATAFS